MVGCGCRAHGRALYRRGSRARPRAARLHLPACWDANLSWSCTAAAIPRSRRSCRTVEVHAVDPLDRRSDMIGEKLGHRLCYHHYGSGRTDGQILIIGIAARSGRLASRLPSPLIAREFIPAEDELEPPAVLAKCLVGQRRTCDRRPIASPVTIALVTTITPTDTTPTISNSIHSGPILPRHSRWPLGNGCVSFRAC
jgi:hypothetical protein